MVNDVSDGGPWPNKHQFGFGHCLKIKLYQLLSLYLSQGEFKVAERYLTMAELCRALREQRVKEMFGSGTACVVCPVGRILYQGEVHNLHKNKKSYESTAL